MLLGKLSEEFNKENLVKEKLKEVIGMGNVFYGSLSGNEMALLLLSLYAHEWDIKSKIGI